MNKLPLIFCLVMVNGAILLGQKTPTVQYKYYNKTNDYGKTFEWVKKGDLRLRWQPLGLINPYDMNLTLGVEYNYNVNKGLSFDVGYIFASLYGQSEAFNSIEPAKGIILRAAHRWYFGKSGAQFLETEAGIKLAKYKSNDQWVGRGVVAGIPAYEQLMSVTSKKEVFTLNVKYGYRIDFGRRSPVSLEFLMGLGVRYRNYYPELPKDAQLTNPQAWFFNPFNYGSGWMPDMPLWLRLTYKL